MGIVGESPRSFCTVVPCRGKLIRPDSANSYHVDDDMSRYLWDLLSCTWIKFSRHTAYRLPIRLGGKPV
ncbi:hypothetical protein L2E82_33836 [Cichorium intybus]|uniref:Uncharacterized protein n=1 Tax=Cichorium intybus TaxID=13427 RepID=A0ACB9BL94_CICIN|nr:hypothetical protein L2E82_33836 [Cichorium intybus]